MREGAKFSGRIFLHILKKLCKKKLRFKSVSRASAVKFPGANEKTRTQNSTIKPLSTLKPSCV